MLHSIMFICYIHKHDIIIIGIYSMIAQLSLYIKFEPLPYRIVLENEVDSSGFDPQWHKTVQEIWFIFSFFFGHFCLTQEPHRCELQGHCCDSQTRAQGNRVLPGDWTGSPGKCKHQSHSVCFESQELISLFRSTNENAVSTHECCFSC